jgi:hypothetical protein
VGAVGVHLAHEPGPGRERAAEARDVGAAEPELRRPVQHLDAQPLGERARAVGRGVVDDEDVVRLAGERGARAGHDGAEAGGLVIGGEDEPDRAGHARVR